MHITKLIYLERQLHDQHRVEEIVFVSVIKHLSQTNMFFASSFFFFRNNIIMYIMRFDKLIVVKPFTHMFMYPCFTTVHSIKLQVYNHFFAVVIRLGYFKVIVATVLIYTTVIYTALQNNSCILIFFFKMTTPSLQKVFKKKEENDRKSVTYNLITWIFVYYGFWRCIKKHHKLHRGVVNRNMPIWITNIIFISLWFFCHSIALLYLISIYFRHVIITTVHDN